MRPKIINDFQKEVLKEVGKSQLSHFFVWSGGTALSFYYLQHRLSMDLDFLSQDLLRDDYLLAQVKKIVHSLKVKKIEERKILNRHEFWFKKNKEILRIEFVFYPFPFLKPPLRIKDFGIRIDSLEDILVNKAHAAYERSEAKDVFDLYCILQTRKIKFLRIFKWVEKKFGVKIDPVLFVAKILKGATNLAKIKPIVLKKELYNPVLIQKYFQKEAEEYLKKKIK